MLSSLFPVTTQSTFGVGGWIRRWLAVAAIAFALTPAQADVRLPAVFSDHMVLQRDLPIPVWGWAAPGEAVTVTFAGHSAATVAEGDGQWKVYLEKCAASATPQTLVVSGKNTLQFTDVLVGDVWVCSGQSNMGLYLGECDNADTEVPRAGDPLLRILKVEERTAIAPEADVKLWNNRKWRLSAPDSAREFSGVGYFFGRELRKHLGIPIGLISSLHGGSQAQLWTSLDAVQKHPDADPEFRGWLAKRQAMLEDYPRKLAEYLPAKAAYDAELARYWNEVQNAPEFVARKDAWEKACKTARGQGKPLPPQPEPSRPSPKAPEPPDGGPYSGFMVGNLYNAMIAPLMPYGIKGVIWYQGESNCGNSKQYRVLFPMMIADWREKWGQGTFPFLFVQLPGIGKPATEPVQEQDRWPGIREAQALALGLPNTGMANIIDVGDPDEVHVKDKLDVGVRLALVARRQVYGEDLVSRGPMYESMRVEGSRLVVAFTNVGSGLMIGVPPWTPSGKIPSLARELKAFAIAGAERKWVWANAQIQGREVAVWSEEVPAPVAVRYGWADNPPCNLYNKEGLPASPFRTDHWEPASDKSPSAGEVSPPVWKDRLLPGDGSINWQEYERIATHAGELAERDYLLGPKYADFHPKAEPFPTLALQADADGWEGPANRKPNQTNWADNVDWYAQAGVLAYVADDASHAGVISAGNGESYIYDSSASPSYGFWYKVNWRTRRCCYLYPEPPELRQPDWHSPRKPVAVASPTGMAPIAQYVAFENGFIGTFPLDKCAYTSKWGCNAIGKYEVTGNIFPWVQLPPGKAPMALAVTPCGEFVLVAVWDVAGHKGQMAVIAVQGRVRCSETKNRDWDSYFQTGAYLYGFPCWPNTKAMKLLGFVDLPIAAPTAIKAGTSMGWQSNGRDDPNINAHLTQLLDAQAERNIWYASDPTVYPNYKATAHEGYVIVASRSENKVVFVDLRPLLEFYRTMYFTTQALYDETKNTGATAAQWPYAFDFRPEQKPVVAVVIDVPSPTAVAAGMSIGHCTGGCDGCNASRNAWKEWRVTPFGGQYAYVATMDGRLLMYTVGGLNGGTAGEAPALFKTTAIGRNPTSIENGNGGVYKNDLFINCRGDKTIYALRPEGEVNGVLRDSRIEDPVMTENSYNGRRGINRYFLHVVDFAAKKVLTYIYRQDFSLPMTFGAASEAIPGHPFVYEQDEVP
jgi:sialate O-acetylesterase